MFRHVSLDRTLRAALAAPAAQAVLFSTDADGWAHGACWPLALALKAWLTSVAPASSPQLALVTSVRLMPTLDADLAPAACVEHVVVRCRLGGVPYVCDGDGVAPEGGWLARWSADESLDQPAFAPYDRATCRARELGWWGNALPARILATLPLTVA